MARTLMEALAPGGACLTLDELAAATGLPRDAARRRLAVAFEARLVERAEQGCYALTEAGREAIARGDITPAQAKGRSAPGRPRAGTDLARIWAAMRVLGKFTKPDLVELACREGQDPARLGRSAWVAIGRLRAAGYLVRLPDGRGPRRWRLVRDTGPLAPQIRRGGAVWDRNLGRVVTADEPPGAAP